MDGISITQVMSLGACVALLAVCITCSRGYRDASVFWLVLATAFNAFGVGFGIMGLLHILWRQS